MGLFSPKQVYEEFYVAFDFSNIMVNEAIDSAVITVTDPDGDDVTDDLSDDSLQSQDGSIVYCWAKGGISGKIYKYTCQVVGVNGTKPELDGYMKVEDI